MSSHRRLLNRLGATALAASAIMSAAGCADADDDAAMDASPVDSSVDSTASDTALAGVSVEVRRDPG